MRWSWNRSKELTRDNDKVYLVVDGFGHNGRIFRETDVDTTVTDLMSEQYVAQVRVVAVNPAEHKSKVIRLAERLVEVRQVDAAEFMRLMNA